MPKASLTGGGWCFACGSDNPIGLKLRFFDDEDRVRAHFRVQQEHQGWPGIIHGGLLATLCDEAMAQWLWRRGILAFTGELRVRFRQEVAVGEDVVVEAWLQAQRGPLYLLAAQVLNPAGEPAVTAEGKFIRRSQD
ncbi:PaaI family thioesterase [Desulfothermobacter acidiphilus]|uniref:PaaI family thioesterase n=1 Tax=Desulfothermobacter acidiphilus TaxID=1938353 RepID=UPI003F886C06